MTALDDWIDDRLDVAARNGAEVRVRSCFFCGRSRTLKINVETFKFFCHNRECEQAGGLLRLVEAVEGCSYDEAVRITKHLVSGVVKAKPLSQIVDLFDDLKAGTVPEEDAGLNLHVPLPGEFMPCWDGKRWRVPKYLTARGVDREMIARWGIGFCPRGDYGGRVVIPVKCAGMSSFVARDTTGDKYQPKYKNPDAASQSHMLFGYDEIEPGRVLAVEGVFDAMRLCSYGFQSVAYMTDHLSPHQIQLLAAKGPIDLVTMPDGSDVNAQAKAIRQARAMENRFRSVRVAFLDSGDPDTATRAEVLRALSGAHEVSEHEAAAVRLRAVRRSPLEE